MKLLLLLGGALLLFNLAAPANAHSVTLEYGSSRNLQREAVAAQLTCPRNEKSVFAHFMVGNAYAWNVAQWERDISAAQTAHIDAFALNIAFNDKKLASSISNAFTAANNKGFKLFFSFDYANGWLKSNVLNYINQYSANGAYFHYKSKPFVSTFEGAGSSDDWVDIKSQTGCFFMPDYSSLGAKEALKLGVADGLFSWAAWPWGNTDMNTYVDASYRDFLKELPYMMPISPWFYTNLPEWDKNWLWRGDDLWYDRWEEALFVQPELIEIISWNDFGECHYVGPVDETDVGIYDLFASAPYNYAQGMPHSAWLLLLPYVIDLYKFGTASVTSESAVTWFRVNPNSAGCSDGGTTGNTATQLQIEFKPTEVMQDKIFFSAVLGSPADVFITVGGVDLGAKWEKTPYGGVGMYHGSVDIGGHLGQVTMTVSRNGAYVVGAQGSEITNACNGIQNGLQNWNSFVMGNNAPLASAATPTIPICGLNCTSGSGAGNFKQLCEFSCAIGYCPLGACYCTGMGVATLPPSKNVVGYPNANEDANYLGLCAFACNYNYCPPEHCGTVSGLPLATPTISPFTPPGCTLGTGDGLFEGLCSFTCNFGYCPMHTCKCTRQGPLNALPPFTPMKVTVASGLDAKLWLPLCEFACTHGWCPSDVCSSGSDEGSVVYIDPSIFTMSAPEVDCQPPCTFVFPPSQYPRPTVINFPPVSTSVVLTLQSGITTIPTVVTPHASTASSVEFWNMPIPSGQSPFYFSLTSSFKPAPLWITVDLITTIYSTEIFFLPRASILPQTTSSDTIIPPQTTSSDTIVPPQTTSSDTIVPPQTTSSDTIIPPQTTSSDTFIPFEWNLPNTVLTSDGTTQWYAEEQLTQYRSLTTPVATTFPWPFISIDGSSKPVISTTPVLISLQRGGFYWSPIPIPTPGPKPALPTLPAPPYPTLPCLKIAGILTIDCPPDKSRPTTSFKSGPAKPTCTTSCGTLCPRNCDSTGKPESECITQTVTDIWVSCSSGSCKTTSTSVASGCDVIGTTTTTDIPYCPSKIGDPLTDDQGDFETHLNSQAIGTATRQFQNPTVVIGSEIYPVVWTKDAWRIQSWSMGPFPIQNVGTLHTIKPTVFSTLYTIIVVPTFAAGDGWTFSVTATGVTQVPYSNQPVCNCNESGCTPESWPCCANGSC
ncbi:Glucan endo-1,3-alpha-glucosidase agn1 [Clarireedia jacksonii]